MYQSYEPHGKVTVVPGPHESHAVGNSKALRVGTIINEIEKLSQPADSERALLLQNLVGVVKESLTDFRVQGLLVSAALHSEDASLRQHTQNLIWANWPQTALELVPLYAALGHLRHAEPNFNQVLREEFLIHGSPDDRRLYEQKIDSAQTRFLSPLVTKSENLYWLARYIETGRAPCPTLEETLAKSGDRAAVVEAVEKIMEEALANASSASPFPNLNRVPLLLNPRYRAERELLQRIVKHPLAGVEQHDKNEVILNLAAHAVDALAKGEQRDATAFIQHEFFRQSGKWPVQLALAKAVSGNPNPSMQEELEDFLQSSTFEQSARLLLHDGRLHGRSACRSARLQAALALGGKNPRLSCSVLVKDTEASGELEHPRMPTGERSTSSRYFDAQSAAFTSELGTIISEYASPAKAKKVLEELGLN